MARRSAGRSDGLALRRALSDRLLPSLVAAMTFLAALALAGAVGASLLAARWSAGAAAVVTVQIPPGPAVSGDTGAAAAAADAARMDRVMQVLRSETGFAEIRPLDRKALVRLLSPWLGGTADPGTGGTDFALPLPGIVELRLLPGRTVPDGLAARLQQAAPGTLLERNAEWTDRLVALTTSLQACAGVAVLVVAGVAAAVVAVATRAALVARRNAIEIVHGLGASDGYIAGRFAARTTWLATLGGLAGTLLSVPLLLALCRLAAPFASTSPDPGLQIPATHAAADDALLLGALLPHALLPALDRVPLPLWIALPLLPGTAAAIGWCTAQVTVRNWLRRLP